MAEAGKNFVVYRTIEAEEAGQRLDNYLFRQLKGVPRSHVYRILRGGEVRVNKKRRVAAYRMQAGDVVRLPPVRQANGEARAQCGTAEFRNTTLPVIYEDAALLAIDKPAGMAVHGGSGVSFGVIETLRRQRPEAKFLELAHRLDRETSGVLLIGKKRAALARLHDMFRAADGLIDKRYLMLVKGCWMSPVRQVRLPLLKYLTESGERRVRVDAENGKFSHSVFRLLARWQRFSLLEGQLKTGRTHQLRVQLAHLGHPILGDEKYGDFALNKTLAREGLKRMALHAARLDCPHPLDAGCNLQLVAPLPKGLRTFIAHLDATESRHGETPEHAPDS
ncbi:MAG: RluA family pseudouridine synthase [Zoogloeaceae bacterium]|jgi:23S rRNA pseudouridine955/2504/2580 synthase|nr:RluA family pseudouridine synthase [Zoogloeaceae bacterium]